PPCAASTPVASPPPPPASPPPCSRSSSPTSAAARPPPPPASPPSPRSPRHPSRAPAQAAARSPPARASPDRHSPARSAPAAPAGVPSVSCAPSAAPGRSSSLLSPATPHKRAPRAACPNTACFLANSQNTKYHQNGNCARAFVESVQQLWDLQVNRRITITYMESSHLRNRDSAPRVCPPVGCIQHRQHRAPFGALANLARPREQLRLPPAQPVHRHQHERAIERFDDLRPLERHRVVRQQLVETERRRPRRRLHTVARRVGPLLL